MLALITCNEMKMVCLSLSYGSMKFHMTTRRTHRYARTARTPVTVMVRELPFMWPPLGFCEF